MNTDIGVNPPRAVSCLVLNLLRWGGANDQRLASEGQAGTKGAAAFAGIIGGIERQA